MTDAHEHHHEHQHDHRPIGYAESIEAFRADKDDYFKHAGAGSPIPVAERDAFTGLPYYPVDRTFRFEGLTLEPYTGNEPSTFQIPTSDGKLRPARRAGVLSFELGGARHRLTGYTFDGEADGHDHGDDDAGHGVAVFVPFLDATSGTETYGAGRYLDIEPEYDGTYTLDFNLAYHPSCVYDIRYSCPLTPAENRLPIRIEAGERLGPDGH